MASLKEVKIRIGSIKSTRQITSAMKMVASAKLHKAQAQIESMLPYQQKLNEILTNFLSTDVSFNTPYTEIRPVSRVAMVVLSSNTSLCGAFNSNVIRLLEKRLKEYRSLGKGNILIYPIGKKVEEAVKKMGYVPEGSYTVLADKPAYVQAYELANRLMNQFREGQIDKVELIYHHFKSMGVQLLIQEDFLPIDLTKITTDFQNSASQSNTGGYNNDYIVEPSAEELIAALLPKVLNQKIYTIVIDSNASEHAARTLAMQTATDNADDLIQELTKQYNKTRQQVITNELLDIIGGSMK